MFAFGILAHSLLFPFIGILLQVFVVNTCFRTTSETTSRSHKSELELVLSDNAFSDDNGSPSFNFVDYFVAPESAPQIKRYSVAVELPLFSEECAAIKPYLFIQFRAPPVVA